MGTTAEEVAAKKHHGKAARKAANEGYKWPVFIAPGIECLFGYNPGAAPPKAFFLYIWKN
ncbi:MULTISPECIES: hypothetical protein [unclassified Paraburkholderia]|uniref:hypothetical protein n=1 Tax=unclassified Paraburkholderia TaxID=2615204 RepID=UPI002AAF47A6|nr:MULTISPECIES: hypothetical protein [unclassified Paraburkholderia]